MESCCLRSGKESILRPRPLDARPRQGPKGKHDSSRGATRHGCEQGLKRSQRFMAVIGRTRYEPSSSTVEGSTRAEPRMEPLWSPVVATGGNQPQIDRPSKSQKQAKSVATGCHRLRATFHGKEGFDGSSPSEGSAKASQIAAFPVERTCTAFSMRWVWSRLWSFQIQKSLTGAPARSRDPAQPLAAFVIRSRTRRHNPELSGPL